MNKFGIFIVRLTVLFIFIVVFAAEANILYQPDNLDFEQGEPGIVPNSWIFPSRLATAGYIAFVDNNVFYEGRQSVAIDNPHYNADTALVGTNENMAALYQSVDAFPYRNKYVKFGAWVKCKPEERDAHGQLWIVARNDQKQTIISLFGKDDKIIDTNWHYKQIIILVPPDTDELRFGFIIEGKGRLWADDATFDILPPADAIDEPAKALTDKELEKLISFANLYGNLIHFYPSNQLRDNLDDERFLLYAVTELLSSESDYIADLNGILQEIAPQAKIIRKGETKNYNIDRPTKITEKIAYAAEIAGGPVVKNSPAFYSKLSNIYATTRSREGSVFQNISVIKYDNMRLEITAWIKVDGKSAGSNAQLWCKAEIIGSNDFEFATTSDNPALSNEWQEYKLEINLPKNVYNLRLALVFLGEGNAYFDDVTIKLFDGDKFVKNIDVSNGNFELTAPNNTLHSWQTESEVLSAGYSIMRTADIRKEGGFSLRISSDLETMIHYPELGEIGRFSVNKEYDLVFPLVLMPRSEMLLTNFSDKFTIKGKPTGYNPNYRDRTTRLALVIQLWSIIKHFSLNQIEIEILNNILHKSLTDVAAKGDYDALMATLNELIKLLDDPRANIWNQFVDAKYGLPIVFNQFGNEIIVTTVIDESVKIEPGDKILKIGGIDIRQVIQNYTKSIVSVNDRFAVSKALAYIRSGRKGSKVSLTISGKDNKQREVEVQRNILLYDIYEPRPEAIMELDPGVYYVDMTQMGDRTFKRISDQISTAKAFIFDMRGFINMSEHVLSLFSKEDISGIKWEIPVYTKPNKELISRKIIHGDIKGRAKYPEAKVVFLIDETTIGYSEAVAALIKQSKIGTLVGTPTAGAIGETLTTRLIGGFSLAYTGMKAFDQNNLLLNSIPIEPNILVPRNKNKFLNFTELLLEKALDIIRN